MSTRIRAAVIPAGGLGTRLLPLTRAVPKERLPDELLLRPNCLSQLLECRDRDGGSAIAAKRVPRADVSRYGIVDVENGPGPSSGRPGAARPDTQPAPAKAAAAA